MTHAPLTLSKAQAIFVALCEHACNGTAGVRKDAPIYREVTEGRDGPTPAARKRYSSCADLAHWAYERIGARAPWLNRASLGGWVAGVNVSRLHGKGHAPARIPGEDWRPEPGDVLLEWNTGLDAHVFVALAYDGATRELRSANYGASGMSEAMFPGGIVRVKPLTRVATAQGAFLHWQNAHSKKRIQRYVRLADVMPLVSVPENVTGITGGCLDAKLQ